MLGLAATYDKAPEDNADSNYGKVVLLGDPGVGKSTILGRLNKVAFERGTGYCTVDFMVYGKRYPTRVWDTAGLEGCNVIPSSYFRGAAAAVVVYDITNEASFLHASSWVSQYRTLTSAKNLVVLVGNKADRADRREVSAGAVEALCKEHNMLHYEMSALDGPLVVATVTEMIKYLEGNMTVVKAARAKGEADPDDLIMVSPDLSKRLYPVPYAVAGGCSGM